MTGVDLPYLEQQLLAALRAVENSTADVRAAMPDEYAPGVLTVVTVGKIRQGVREAPAKATAIIRAHGGAI